MGLRGMSVANVDAMRSAGANPSPPDPLSPKRGEGEIDFVLTRAIDSCSYYPRCVEDPLRKACIRVEANSTSQRLPQFNPAACAARL